MVGLGAHTNINIIVGAVFYPFIHLLIVGSITPPEQVKKVTNQI